MQEAQRPRSAACKRFGLEGNEVNGETLLSRDDFREIGFIRDDNKCVICGSLAQDFHHIIERRLWPDGGYYLDNGVSVCGKHHIEAEQTTLSCDDLRLAAGIKTTVLPPHLYADQPYTKWGDPILPNGRRLRGELFEDESVQTILRQGGVLGLYDLYVKYPRTWHLPWSPNITDDDRALSDTSSLDGRDCIVTVKMDGENTSLYDDYLHARSIDYEPHPSRSRIKALWSESGWNIPHGWRVCGENLTAKHAIHYQHLRSYFQMFSIWNDKNVCLDWDSTEEWAALLGFPLVPVVWSGPYHDDTIKAVWKDLSKNGYEGDEVEGIVVRSRGSFHYKDFRSNVAKVVRANHVPLHGGHWRRGLITENVLAVMS